ncbi:MAG: transposase [Planctomycetes bacterium]|nr:transposase [Planctomycetota bacterium]
MTWDQACFHASQKVKVWTIVTILLALPAYSPQLNPIEKLWQYLRRHYWSNRVYGCYNDLRMAACQARQQVCLN